MNEIRYFGFVDDAGKMQIHGRHSFVEEIRLFTGKAIDIIEAEREPTEIRDEILDFIRNSNRGVMKGFGSV